MASYIMAAYIKAAYVKATYVKATLHNVGGRIIFVSTVKYEYFEMYKKESLCGLFSSRNSRPTLLRW